MIIVLEIIGTWLLFGLTGWVAGIITDLVLDDLNENPLKLFWLCVLCGPIVWLVVFRSITLRWIQRGK